MGLPRSALASQLRRQVDDLKDTGHLPLLRAFLPWNLWPWVRGYLKYVFHKKHPFAVYGTCCHLISLDITQCPELTVPKLSQASAQASK
jgi:hypothetical protein